MFDVVSSGVWWIFWRIFYRGFLGIILINLLTNFYDKLFWRSFLLTFWQLSLTKIFWWILLIFNIFDEFDDEFLMKILTNFWMNVLKNLSNFFCKFFWQILFTIFLTNFGLIRNLLKSLQALGSEYLRSSFIIHFLMFHCFLFEWKPTTPHLATF